jgi:nucleosome binding factor SPN SPT16 subunit
LAKLRGEGGDEKEEEEEEDKAALLPTPYSNPSLYPSDLAPNTLHVDMDRECLFAPINGVPVPIHVSFLKNVSASDIENNLSFLRMNFFTPLQSVGKDAPRAAGALVETYGGGNGGADLRSVWIKELSYASSQHAHIQNIVRRLMELKKRIKDREKKEQMEEDMVEQPNIELLRGMPVPRLKDMQMRPFLSGRKTVGQLECHANGLRFVSTKGEHFTIIYANIKNMIYAPCTETDERVLFHFTFKHALMIGKKKSYTCQFFAQVVDTSQNVSGSSRSMHDPDELDEEQRERKLRKRLNDMFKEYAKKVQKISEEFADTGVRGGRAVRVDTPFRDLGFFGTVGREMSPIFPTVYTLSSFDSQMCVNIDEIDHVHFERVSFACKNFDMVLILKDYSKPVVTIVSIERKYLEQL